MNAKLVLVAFEIFREYYDMTKLVILVLYRAVLIRLLMRNA